MGRTIVYDIKHVFKLHRASVCCFWIHILDSNVLRPVIVSDLDRVLRLLCLEMSRSHLKLFTTEWFVEVLDVLFLLEREKSARKPNQGHAKHPVFPVSFLISFCIILSQATDVRLRLDHKSLDLVLESADLAHEVRGLVGGDGGSNDGAGNTASATESHLGGNVAVATQVSALLRIFAKKEKWVLTCRQRSCPRRAGECAKEWPEEQCRQRG